MDTGVIAPRAGLLQAAVRGCVIALALAVLAQPLQARAAAEGPFYIQGTEVNLREAPDGAVQTQLDINEKVFVVKRKDGWAYVSAPRLEIKGWVSEQFIGKQKRAADTPAQPAAKPQSVAKQPVPTADDMELGGDLTTEIVISSGSEMAECVNPAQEATPAASAVRHDGGLLSRDASSSAPIAEDDEDADGLQVLANFQPGSTAGQPLNQRSASGFVADGAAAPATQVPATPAPSKLQQAPPAPPAADKYVPQEQGKPSLQFNGNATTVVTSPMMLEGSFFAVGGRDMGKINGTDVNLRQKPDPKAKSIAKLQPGDKLYLTTFKNDWFEVSVPGRKLTGWVHSKYVHEFPKVEITGTQVRLRAEPNTDCEIKDTLDKGEVFYEYERKNGWVKVASSASGVNGWVKGDYVGKTERSASVPYTVKGDDVNFRASPEVDADIIARLPKGTAANVFGRNEKWSYIEVQGRYGWMYSEYLLPGGGGSRSGAPGSPSRPARGFIVPSSPVGERLIARAKEMSGTPYVWGGESDSGVDCSGLIYKVLLDEGASGKCLPRRASEQMAQLGLAIDKENLEPGDLVFFTTYKAGPSHVGIYLGDGDFIHASSAQHKVTISNLSEGYYKQRFVGARRITEDEIRSLK